MLVGQVHLSQLEHIKYRRDLKVYFMFLLSHHIGCDMDCGSH